MLWSIAHTHTFRLWYAEGVSLKGALVQSSALSSAMFRVDWKTDDQWLPAGYNGAQMPVLIKRLMFGTDRGKPHASGLISQLCTHFNWDHPTVALVTFQQIKTQNNTCRSHLLWLVPAWFFRYFKEKHSLKVYYILTLYMPSLYRVQKCGWAKTEIIERQSIATLGTNLVRRYHGSFAAPIIVTHTLSGSIKPWKWQALGCSDGHVLA